MRRLREIWNDPNVWRWTLDESWFRTCGCVLAEFVFWGVAVWLYLAYIR